MPSQGEIPSVNGQDGRGVAADGEEGGVPQGKLARVAARMFQAWASVGVVKVVISRFCQTEEIQNGRTSNRATAATPAIARGSPPPPQEALRPEQQDDNHEDEGHDLLQGRHQDDRPQGLAHPYQEATDDRPQQAPHPTDHHDV